MCVNRGELEREPMKREEQKKNEQKEKKQQSCKRKRAWKVQAKTTVEKNGMPQIVNSTENWSELARMWMSTW